VRAPCQSSARRRSGERAAEVIRRHSRSYTISATAEFVTHDYSLPVNSPCRLYWPLRVRAARSRRRGGAQETQDEPAEGPVRRARTGARGGARGAAPRAPNAEAKGDASEDVWLELLADHLPHRYRVANGIIIDADGRESHYIDIIVYDRQYTPTRNFSHAGGRPFTATSPFTALCVQSARAEPPQCVPGHPDQRRAHSVW
jgi:hypothetical protein